MVACFLASILFLGGIIDGFEIILTTLGHNTSTLVPKDALSAPFKTKKHLMGFCVNYTNDLRGLVVVPILRRQR